MNVLELIEKARKEAETHILGKSSVNHELENGDTLNCSIESASAIHSGQSWRKVCFYYKSKNSKKYKKFSKSKAIELIS